MLSTRLPLLISLPHAGLHIPPEVASSCIMSEEEIRQDGDEGAADIYRLADEAAAFVTTDVARAIVDVNRAEDDRRRDGVVKTHTCWNAPVYREFPPESVIGELLKSHYHPYHQRLGRAASGVLLGIDCHTMAAEGPPVGPDPGKKRPLLSLCHADGTCPDNWLRSMAKCLEGAFRTAVAINDPFRGGFIIRSHAHELPWIQLEISRGPVMSTAEKRDRVLAALRDWCKRWG
jgi:N-formylglutamate deformylase